MCAPCLHRDDTPEWIRSAQLLAWEHRAVIVPAACVVLLLATLAGTLFYLLSPTDIERAEANLQKSQAVVVALYDESEVCLKDAKEHKLVAAEYRKLLDEHKDTPDTEWLEWRRAMADGHTQLHRAKRDRRDALLHLAAGYLRLLAEAEGEILRARDARDRGTPYAVAPRVRTLLAPVLAGR